MVIVNMQIAFGGNIQIDQTVARDLVEHMVEKRYAGRELRLTIAIQIDADGDLCFEGIAGDGGLACSHVALQSSKSVL
jgi:hypothetical protein